MQPNDIDAPVRRRSALTQALSLFANPLSLATGLFAALVSVLLVWLVVIDDPLGGEPVAMIEIDPSRVADAQDPSDGQLAIRDILNPQDPDGDEDRPEQTETAMQPDALEPLDQQFDNLKQTTSQVSQSLPTAPIKGLTERGAHGLLPQISANGTTPAKAYARPVTRRQSDPNVAKIAILIGGLGLSATGTSVAINRLPENVTLAFAPYAAGLQQWADKARQNGHEIMLQLPMEPFDYPSNDPGPHTLLSSLSPRDNIRRLEWLMARLTGYFGVTNYMGAKFTSSTDALRPVLKQLNRRGLVYLEDGTSARSQSQRIARQLSLKAASADLTIDTTPSVAAINAALAQLETIALERGIAVGVASALPITVDRIIEWTEGLEAKGIVLVPVSKTIALRQNLS